MTKKSARVKTATVIIGFVLALMVISIMIGFDIVAFNNTIEYQLYEDEENQRREDEEQSKFIEKYNKKQEEKRKHKHEAHNKRYGASDL